LIEFEKNFQALNSHRWKPRKGKTALLLIDLQEYFRDYVNPILNNILRVIEVSHEKKIPIIFTQHGNLPEEKQNLLRMWWGGLIFKGSPEARLLPEIRVGKNEFLVEKTRYSAFFKTSLEDKLKQLKIRDLVIGGVMTNLCCETTARDAFMRDFRVFFLADGTSTVSEKLHLASLKNLSFGFSILLTSRQWEELLRNW